MQMELIKKSGLRNLDADKYYTEAIKIGIVISNWTYRKYFCKAEHKFMKFISDS